MGALERARGDIDAGRLWKARDRLEGLLRTAPEQQDALRLLGEVCNRMGDLPAAGKYWYLTEDCGGEAGAEARLAFEERCGRSAAQMLRALPVKPPLDRYPQAVRERIAELGGPSLEGDGLVRKAGPPTYEADPGRGTMDTAGCLVVLALVALTAGIWVLGWIYLVERVL